MTEETQASLEDTGERMVPEFHNSLLIYAEHWTRYKAAENLVAGKKVLDIACGSGYGSHLLAQWADHVIGVDLDEDAVAYCKKHYSAPNIEYLVGDAVKIPLPDQSVDVVITYETIEHIADYRHFLSEVRRVLKPGGLAVVSTPNDPEFAEGNHFHLHEFEYDELRALLKEYFQYTNSYFQKTWKSVVIGPEDLIKTKGVTEIPLWNLAPGSRENSLYFFELCSDVPITVEVNPLAAVGEHYSDRAVAAQAETYLNLQKQVTTQANDLHRTEVALLEAKGELDSLKATVEILLNSRSYKLSSGISKVGHAVIDRIPRPK